MLNRMGLFYVWRFIMEKKYPEKKTPGKHGKGKKC
jgi:hypothetical protein